MKKYLHLQTAADSVGIVAHAVTEPNWALTKLADNKRDKCITPIPSIDARTSGKRETGPNEAMKNGARRPQMGKGRGQ